LKKDAKTEFFTLFSDFGRKLKNGICLALAAISSWLLSAEEKVKENRLARKRQKEEKKKADRAISTDKSRKKLVSADSTDDDNKDQKSFPKEKRSRNEYKSRIVGRLAGKMILFTVVYVGVIVLYLSGISTTDFGYELQYTIERLLKNINYGFYYFVKDYIGWILLFVYLVVMIAIPIRTVSRIAGYVDRIHSAAGSVLDKETAVPELPRDIREIGTTLREIKVSITQSEQLAKEAEQRKNDLVVYLAHDLKTPLASIIGYLTLLEESPDLPVKQRAKYMGITLNKAYRLEQLINEFFDITRFNLQSVELEKSRVDISLMLEQIADEFYPVLEEKQLSITTDIEPHLRMLGDSDKLARVFDNLLRNAVNYSYSETEINISAWRHKSKIAITVRNSGDEIPPQTLERLFEKFFRADSSRHSSTGGSGLGLAIAKQIVELHGGKISAVSNSRYTEFRIILPVQS